MARFTFYEFFAGGGMARAGLGPDWQCLFANDFDSKKADAYRANWGDREMWCGDVANVRVEHLPGCADLVWASFPCQDLSLAGNGAGLNGGRSGAFWPFWRVVERLIDDGRKPRAIVLENVCGLLTSHGGADFETLCRIAGSAGYKIGAIVADAKDFLPQSRPRLFIVALDDRYPMPGRIQSPYAVDYWHPRRLREAQASLPESSRARWYWFTPPVPAVRNSALSDIVEDCPTDVSWHTEAETGRLLSMMSPVNRAKVELVINNKSPAFGAIYKRTRIEAGKKVQRAEVRFDLAGCLRTPGGGSSRQSILVAVNGKVRTRLISARETARLMGLGDDFVLPARYNDAYHLTGDGVAVPVVRWLAAHLLEPTLALNSAAHVAA
ncbi:MAG: DNA cytosine methyltransferase [Novosphingobium sp.]